MSIQDILNTNPARTVMDMKRSMLQVIVYTTSEYQDLCLDNDEQTTFKRIRKPLLKQYGKHIMSRVRAYRALAQVLIEL